MAASVSSGEEDGAVSDINITPLVDVVLVLLIVFMISVPATKQEKAKMKIDLPIAYSGAPKDVNDLKIEVFVRKDKESNIKVYLGEQLVDGGLVGPELKKNNLVDPNQTVSISCDKDIDYGEMIRVMDSLHGVGMKKLALNIQKLKKN